jgi:hypothetical protein
MFNLAVFKNYEEPPFGIEINNYLAKVENNKNILSKYLITKEKTDVLDASMWEYFNKKEGFDEIGYELCEDLYCDDVSRYIYNKGEILFTFWEWNYLYLLYVEHLGDDMFQNKPNNPDFITVEDILNSQFYKDLERGKINPDNTKALFYPKTN